MAKHLAVTLLMIALVLCSSSVSSRAARPDPTSTSAVKSTHSDEGLKVVEEDPLESCEGKKDEEECLMRRTMIAHIDYIYTQSRHH